MPEEANKQPYLYTDLSPSARIIVSYMQFEDLINGRQWVTFSDIVRYTGLSQRAVRGALSELKAKGLVEAILDVESGRRHLYRLIQKNITLVEEKVEPAVYLVDVGLGIPTMLSFRAYRAIRASAAAYHTRSVPRQFLEYTKCTCALIPIEYVKPGQVASIASKVTESGGSISILFDQLLDWEFISAYVNSLREAGVRAIRHIASASPLTIATQMLLTGIGGVSSYRRDNLAIHIVPVEPGKDPEVKVRGSAVKVIEVRKRGGGVEVDLSAELGAVKDYYRVLIIYEVLPSYGA